MAKKKMKDKRREQIKEQKKIDKLKEKNKPITFKCLDCGIEEDIPKNEGDITVPPRFSCEVCGGTMEPIEYTSEQGITYRLENQA